MYAWTTAYPATASADAGAADRTADEAAANRHEQVRMHYERGRTHYANAAYEQAAREFKLALDVSTGLETPKIRHALLANLALTHERRAESSEQPNAHWRRARTLYQQLVDEEDKLSPHTCPAHASALSKLSELPDIDPADKADEPAPSHHPVPAPSSTTAELERSVDPAAQAPAVQPLKTKDPGSIALAAIGSGTTLASVLTMTIGLVRTRQEIAYADGIINRYDRLDAAHPDQDLRPEWLAYRDSELPRLQTTWSLVGAAGMTAGLSLVVAAIIRGVHRRRNPTGKRSVQSSMQLGRTSHGLGFRF